MHEGTRVITPRPSYSSSRADGTMWPIVSRYRLCAQNCLRIAGPLLLLASVACGSSKTPSPAAPTPSPEPAQPTYVVSGTVRDGGNLNLLANTHVTITAGSTSLQADTGFDGVFSFPGIRGPASVGATAGGYEAQTVTATVAAATTFDIRLRRVVGRAVPCGDGPDAGNRVLSLFSSPFSGTFPLTNYFDHDLPVGTSSNGFQHTYCDERVTGRIDGHPGYDWLMPVGTPLLAVADGQVTNLGTDAPFYCPALGRTVSDQQFVEIRHPAVNGEEFSSVFVHLSRIDVSVGQAVARHQTVGLSGNTGCSTEPHLHMQVWRFTHTNNGRPTLTDPYGWEGVGLDPWAQDPSGASSHWLWRPGESPALHPR
jgi:murein DD-endopeptidase MepM/ murein hydrolase activator NlpD